VYNNAAAIIPGFAGHEELQAAEADARDAAMRTITIMLPMRHNESPAPVDERVRSPSAHGGPRHGPLSGQLVGALSQKPPFLVSRWSARFDIPPPRGLGADGGPSISDADRDGSSGPLSSSPLSPGFIFNLLTGGRYQPPPQEAAPAELPAWSRSTANEIQRQQMASQAPPEVEWRPPQLLQRYVELHRQQPFALHRDGPRGDTMLKNNVLMTAVAYGLLGGDRSQHRTTSPSTTTPATTATTTSANRKRKSSSEYRRRAPGRYRSYPAYPGGRRALRRQSDFDLTLDSDDDDDEVLEALFGYDPSPMTFRRVRRPSSSSAGARRGHGRRRLGDGGSDRRGRRWRQRGDGPGKLRRRTGGRAIPSGDRQKQAARSRRPNITGKPGEQQTKPDVGPATDSSRRVSLLHIVVSRQQDFAAPQPALGLADRPGLRLEPRPLDVDAPHSLPHHPFIQRSPPFLPPRPVFPDTQRQPQQQDRYVMLYLKKTNSTHAKHCSENKG